MKKTVLAAAIVLLVNQAKATQQYIYICPRIVVYHLASIGELHIKKKLDGLGGEISEHDMNIETRGELCVADRSWCSNVILIGTNRIDLKYSGPEPDYVYLKTTEFSAKTCEYLVQSL